MWIGRLRACKWVSMSDASSTQRRRTRIPRTVWALGLVSFFMDISSETIHALLPLFLTTTLGASVLLVGIIDGVAESTAAISKVFSGYLSDWMGRRKPLILLGYGMGALSKPFFAIAATPLLVFGARFADRIGKGLRGASRDALVADVTPPRDTRPRLWTSPSARHSRRLRRPADRDRADGALRRQYARCVLGRAHPHRTRRCSCRCWG